MQRKRMKMVAWASERASSVKLNNHRSHCWLPEEQARKCSSHRPIDRRSRKELHLGLHSRTESCSHTRRFYIRRNSAAVLRIFLRAMLQLLLNNLWQQRALLRSSLASRSIRGKWSRRCRKSWSTWSGKSITASHPTVKFSRASGARLSWLSMIRLSWNSWRRPNFQSKLTSRLRSAKVQSGLNWLLSKKAQDP